MTKIFTLIALLCLPILNAYGQKILGSKDVAFYGSTASNPGQILRIDDQSFLYLDLENETPKLIKYNEDMSPVFSIATEPSEILPIYGLNKNSGDIILFQIFDEPDDQYSLKAYIYSGKSGKLKDSKYLYENEEDLYTPKLSENGEYSVLYSPSDKKGKKPYRASIYKNETLELQGQIKQLTDKKEDLILFEISNRGELLVGFLPQDNLSLKLQIFDIQGDEKRNITQELDPSGKQYYKDFRFKDTNKEGILVASREVNDNLEGLDVWTIDYDNHSLNSTFSVDLDKDFIKNELFKKYFDPVESNPGSELLQSSIGKPPSRLKAYDFTNFLTFDNNIVFLFDQRLFSSRGEQWEKIEKYRTKNILVTSFDKAGNYKWDVVVERKAENIERMNTSHPYKPGWTGLTAHMQRAGDEIGLLTWESVGFAKHYFMARKINPYTGEVTVAKPVSDDSATNIHRSYLTWLNNKNIAFLNMKGVNFSLSKRNFKVQVVEIIR